MVDKKEIPNLILNNADDLLDTAQILIRNNKIQYAGHFAVYSIEESMKSVMKYADIYHLKDLCNHYKKENMLSIIHYILGKLSVVYLFEKLGNSDIGNSPWRSTTKEIGGILAIKATDISSKIHKEIKDTEEKYKIKPIKPTYKLDKIRKNSVYSNPDTGERKTIDEDEIHESIRMATFVSAFVRMLINEDFTWDRFFEIAPEAIKNEMILESEELVTKLKQNGDK